ncbi:Golgi apparatus membrane protein TVP38 [Mycena olivaceomarginata]|nr:Golgi apparatus membrane protein TVP38 [Mycena olivaceomarginata]
MSYAVDFVKALPRKTFRRYQKLPFYGKASCSIALIWLWTLFEICLVIAIVLITPSRVAQFMYDNAEKLANYPFGWLLVGLIIVAISFPPLHGHTTVTTLCGFAWGLNGFFIAAPASLIGAVVVFFTLRLSFRERLRTFSKSNEKWQALETVIAAKGLPLIILIRMSPLPPWVYSNILFASIGSVTVWQFIGATFFVFPKLFLHVFIGSRIAALSDGETRGKMDTNAKVINGLLIGGGIVIAFIASWFVYTSIQNHIRRLPGLSAETDELAAEALEDTEDAPLLTSENV